MKYGITIDIGTTNITAFLIDLATSNILDKRMRKNPQYIYGADILSRFAESIKKPAVKNHLNKLIIESLNSLLQEIYLSNKIKKEQVSKISIVGNTMMHAFLINADPLKIIKSLGTISRKINLMSTKEIPLNINPAAKIILPDPLINYIGSDALAMILHTDLIHKKNSLAIDFGTNNEIALNYNGKLLLTSVAGGPAFEEKHIAIATPAQEGAIYKVGYNKLKQEFEYFHFGKEAKSICGSGIIDLIAELKRNNFLDENGKLKGGASFSIIPNLTISQKDIRSVQLAKASLSAAIQLLFYEAKITIQDIDNIFIAGIFGRHINIENAMYIGYLPKIDKGKIKILEDCAAKGAGELLTKDHSYIEGLMGGIQYLDLAKHPLFQDEFVKNMRL